MTADKPNRGLLALRDHCRQQGARDDADPLWARIADEIDDYLQPDEPDRKADDDALF